MAEKLALDLFLVLLGVSDERYACVARLTGLLQAVGVERVHVRNGKQTEGS